MTLDDFVEGLPDDLLYVCDTDLWIRPESDALWVIGANAFVTKHGKFLIFYPKPEGHVVERHAPLGAMETWKTAFGIEAPFDCEIIRGNPEVASSVQLAVADPYGRGWLFEVRPLDPSESKKSLMTARAYKDWLRDHARSQFEHLSHRSTVDELQFDPYRNA